MAVVGATAFSGDVVYAGGTTYQHVGGYNGTAEERYTYLDANAVSTSGITFP